MGLSETPPSVVSDEAKRRYRIAIRRAFSIFGSDPSRYYPNDFGCELLANASILIKGECNTGDGGVMWAGELRIGNKRIGVENRGDGGCNIYRPVLDRDASDNERTAVWRIEEEFTKLVHRGFDELQDTEALDDFCSVLGQSLRYLAGTNAPRQIGRFIASKPIRGPRPASKYRKVSDWRSVHLPRIAGQF